jgi:hypothetical protein
MKTDYKHSSSFRDYSIFFPFIIFLLATIAGYCFYICKSPGQNKLLFYAIRDNDLSSLTSYLNNNGDPNIALDYVPGSWATALHLATREGQTEIVRILLDSGADPNAICSQGKTPLRWAVSSLEKPGQKECAKLLLERGADPNATDPDGISVLLSACVWSDVRGLEIAKVIIENGADVNKSDKIGNRPLHGLAKRGTQNSTRESAVEVARMLLEHGADIRAKNRQGETALDLARSSRFAEMIELLANKNKHQGSK